MRNCLTVDVEEWFHVCGVGGPLAVEHWDELPSRVVETTNDLLDLLDADIVKAGHEIGSHGHFHRRVYELTPEAFSEDLESSRAALSQAGVRSVHGYRAPEWSINGRSLWALDLLARSGFVFDSSMAPMRIVGDPNYPQVPHARSTAFGDVMEFPPLVDRRFGHNMPLGGGWGFRMTDPRRILKAIEDRNGRGIPVAVVVHPWEIDPDPPRVKLPLAKSFAHYFQLGGFRDRLEQVIRGARFAPMGEVLGLGSLAR
jgi:polysaccharide deacetylase family protein (PEP-CTERM system associated)